MKLIRVWRALIAAMTVDHCPAILPWFVYRHGKTDLDLVRLIAHRSRRQRAPTLPAKITSLVATVTWPLRTAVHSLIWLWAYGRKARLRSGISRPIQFLQMMYFANLHNFSPRSYYDLRLFEPQVRSKARLFVHDHEIIALHRALNRHADTYLVQDKQRFYEYCVRGNIPTPRVEAAFRGGQIDRWYGSEEGRLPRCDLFVKPVDLVQGVGIERWDYDAESDRWCFRDEALNEAQFLDHCRWLSKHARFDRFAARERGFLVQRRVHNHDRLDGLWSNGVCIVRTMTFRRPGQEPGNLGSSTFRIPTGRSYLITWSEGAIYSPIDEASGRIGAAMDRDLNFFTHHPDTQKPIVGFEVPLWHRLLDTCVAAHRAATELAFIAWDAAITPDGPMILEGNLDWGTALLQTPNGPLGETVFPACYLENYRAQRRGRTRDRAARA